jgi:hypothetical protein
MIYVHHGAFLFSFFACVLIVLISSHLLQLEFLVLAFPSFIIVITSKEPTTILLLPFRLILFSISTKSWTISTSKTPPPGLNATWSRTSTWTQPLGKVLALFIPSLPLLVLLVHLVLVLFLSLILLLLLLLLLLFFFLSATQ